MQVDAAAEQGFKGEGILSGDPGCRGFYDHFKDTIDVTMYYWLFRIFVKGDDEKVAAQGRRSAAGHFRFR